jgi:hypothetical protein
VDPILRAASEFSAEAEAFWRADPGRVLPMVAGEGERGEIVKALRLQELALGNRRPLFLHEEPFKGPRAYFDGLTDAIRQDYAKIREGVAEEGVTLPLFPAISRGAPRTSDPMERAVFTAALAAGLLGDRFQGLCLSLVPPSVADPLGWRESIAALRRLQLPLRVRLAVFAPPGGPLDGVFDARGARLRIDDDELRDYIENLSRRVPA